VLEFYLDRARTKGIAVRVDPERLRPSDVMVLEGDPAKIHKALGWQTEIPFERTLTDLLEYWRRRVASA
jgi:GDP-4-dehydro-6-deoxy-D-mannose reductase